MAHFRDSVLDYSRIDVLPTDPPQPRGSVLQVLLPSIVQGRIPRLPSIRRSVGLGRKRSHDSSSEPSSGARTPEVGYASAMILTGSSSPGDESSTEHSDASTFSYENPPRPQTGVKLNESVTGIEWKFANQGLGLLSLAVGECSTVGRDHVYGNASFARQLYVHALTYLLRALPADLTTEEKFSIRGSLPSGVVEPLRMDASSNCVPTGQPAENNQPSILHRTLASTIVQLFIFFQFILPYLKYLLHSAYEYDRQNKISEKFLSQSIEAVDIVGKQGLSLTTAIYGMGDGRVGQMITETAAWFVEGVTGGIHDGVGKGLTIMGARKSQTVERR